MPYFFRLMDERGRFEGGDTSSNVLKTYDCDDEPVFELKAHCYSFRSEEQLWAWWDTYGALYLKYLAKHGISLTAISWPSYLHTYGALYLRNSLP